MVKIKTDYKKWILKRDRLVVIMQPFDDLRKNWGYGNPVEGIKHVKYEDMIQLTHPNATRYFPLLRDLQRVTDPLFRTLRDVKTGFFRTNDGGEQKDIEEFKKDSAKHPEAMRNLKRDVLTKYVEENRDRLEALKKELTTLKTSRKNHYIAIIDYLLSQVSQI